MSGIRGDGSVLLYPHEAERLRGMIRRWHTAAEQSGAGAGDAVLDLACEIRELLDMQPGQTEEAR